jgi:hypothetical protein
VLVVEIDELDEDGLLGELVRSELDMETLDELLGESALVRPFPGFTTPWANAVMSACGIGGLASTGATRASTIPGVWTGFPGRASWSAGFRLISDRARASQARGVIGWASGGR